VNDGGHGSPFRSCSNPFQVISLQRHPEPYPGLEDVCLVQKRGRPCAIPHFASTISTGLNRYHCHILVHEELGMMGTL